MIWPGEDECPRVGTPTSTFTRIKINRKIQKEMDRGHKLHYNVEFCDNTSNHMLFNSVTIHLTISCGVLWEYIWPYLVEFCDNISDHILCSSVIIHLTISCEVLWQYIWPHHTPWHEMQWAHARDSGKTKKKKMDRKTCLYHSRNLTSLVQMSWRIPQEIYTEHWILLAHASK